MHRGRPALRPRRRRRRLRRVRRRSPRSRPRRRAGLAHARCVVLDRGQRGERQPRPAGPPRRAGRSHRPARASWSASTPAALDTERLWVTTSLRGLAGGDADRARCSTRACTPATASGVVPSSFRIMRQLLDRDRGRRHRRGAARRAARRRSRPTGSPRRRRTAAELDPSARRATSRSPGRPGRWPTTPSSSCSPAPGDRRSATSAPTASRRPAGPATCCARRRRCRSACACRRRAIRTRRSPRWPRRSTPTRRRRHGHVHRSSDAAPGWNAPAVRAVAAGGARRRVDRRLRRARRGRSARAARSRSWACSGRCSPTAQFVITGVLGAGQQRPRAERVPPPPDGAARHASASPACSPPTPDPDRGRGRLPGRPAGDHALGSADQVGSCPSGQVAWCSQQRELRVRMEKGRIQ